jgi:hypothetical protein
MRLIAVATTNAITQGSVPRSQDERRIGLHSASSAPCSSANCAVVSGFINLMQVGTQSHQNFVKMNTENIRAL